MGLIPATLSDGTGPHTIALRGQMPSSSAILTEYFEPGGSLTAYTDYKVPKAGATVMRQSCRVVDVQAIDTDGNTRPITINIGLTYDKRHNEADVASALTVAFNTLPDAAARLNFVRRLP